MTTLRQPTREVVHGDAIAWLESHPGLPGASLVTSLPDVSELGTTLASWETFFTSAATACLRLVPDHGVAVFFQTDLKRDGRWISKAAPLLQVAATLDIPLLWHKVVCRKPPGQRRMGRPGYSHLLAFSRQARDAADRATADVLPDEGELAWSHSMGSAAAALSIRFICQVSPETQRIVAPFCGAGTALAWANAAGLDAIGIERNKKRAESARQLVVSRAPDTPPADRESLDPI